MVSIYTIEHVPVASLLEESNDQSDRDERNNKARKGQTLVETQKAHPIGKLITMAKYCCPVSCCLASSLASVVKDEGSKRPTKNLLLAIFFSV